MNKLFLLLCLCLPQLVLAQTAIPADIQPPKAHSSYLTVSAKGVQIYQCIVDHGIYTWRIQAPDAGLFDENNELIGKHYQGPIWEYKSGSRIQGRVLKSITPTDTAISWLLVEVVAHKGEGAFSSATYINRVNTVGGLAPLSVCDGNHLGSEKKIPYSASYVFNKPVM